MRDLPTCADLPADYCPAEKSPSPELFQQPPDLEDSSSSQTAENPQLEPLSEPVAPVTQPIAPAAPEPEMPAPSAFFSAEEDPPIPRQVTPERLGPNEVQLSPPATDVAWSAAPVLQSGQSKSTAKAVQKSTGSKDNGCWQCS